MKQGILFSTPCYGGQMFTRHVQSIMALEETLLRLGLEYGWNLGTRESLVHRGRMKMTASFLGTGFSHMMWLDADIEFTPDDVARLWNLNADIAVGVYPMKVPDKSWYAAWVNGELVKDLDQFTEPIAVDYAGTGFMLVRREAIEKVHAHLRAKEERYLYILEKLDDEDRAFMREFTPDASFDDDVEGIPALYMTPIFNGGLESEDYHFCRVAREAGLSVMMDPSVRLVHWGQYGYGAS